LFSALGYAKCEFILSKISFFDKISILIVVLYQ